MSLRIQLDLPPDVEQKLRENADLSTEVKEAYALELFRSGRLSHFDLSRVLGLDRFETDAFLKRHHVLEGSLTMEDLEADFKTIGRLTSKHR